MSFTTILIKRCSLKDVEKIPLERGELLLAYKDDNPLNVKLYAGTNENGGTDKICLNPDITIDDLLQGKALTLDGKFVDVEETTEE